MATSCALSLCLLYCMGCGPDDSSSNKGFALRTEVVQALEGGPFVIKATLSYHGHDATEIYSRNWVTNASVEVPKSWKYRLRPQLLFGMPGGQMRLSPGEEKTETLRVHNNHSGIAAGKATVIVTWDVYAPGKAGEPGERIVNLSVPLEVDVPPATPERLAALRKRMEEQLRAPHLSDNDRCDLADEIINTRHQELAPVAWRMIETAGPFDPTYDLIKFVAECPGESGDP